MKKLTTLSTIGALDVMNVAASVFDRIDRHINSTICDTLADIRQTSQKAAMLGSSEYFPLEANTVIQSGQMVGIDASNNLVPANNASCIRVLGAAGFTVDNSTPPSGQYTNAYGLTGAAGQGSCEVKYGENCWNNDTVAGGVIAVEHIGLPCFAKDDETVSLSDGAGAYLPAGIICGVGDERGGGNKQVHVQQGPLAVAAATAAYDSGSGGGSDAYEPLVAHRVRAVITTMVTYTAAAGVITVTATNSNPTYDGVTPAVGDVVLLPAAKATTASDEGPYVVTTKGASGVHCVLSRPSWWETGSTQYDGAILELGSEGSVWAGTTWKSMPAAKSFVVDTTAPDFYPRTQSATSASMIAGVSTAITTLYIAPEALVAVQLAAAAGVPGFLRVSTQTAGLPTASSLIATSTSTTDTSTVKFLVTNF